MFEGKVLDSKVHLYFMLCTNFLYDEQFCERCDL